ncbi:carbon-nitrogen hydrolase family protein [Streptomyces sp. NPDC048270]|uniref:carbon-nitrogen hydrolase family protein n=1 Tax=Streptomyces sp. NPDC048270 TaxID=3154615 RepID=UPI0033D33944
MAAYIRPVAREGVWSANWACRTVHAVARTLRLAVAQSTVPEDPTDRGALRAAGEEIRALMVEAAGAAVRLVQLPEGAIVYPSKHVMAAGPAGELVAADWSRAAWDVLREEAESIAALAGQLGLWTVFGSIHPLTPPNRPHNSLYIVSDRGRLVARYDKRFLSDTEVSYLYSPGQQPLVFEVDGIRFGFALCIEANFPEVFAEYESLDVDCVLLSVMVDDAPRARVAQAYGTLYNYWLGYSVPAHRRRSSLRPPVAPLSSRRSLRRADPGRRRPQRHPHNLLRPPRHWRPRPDSLGRGNGRWDLDPDLFRLCSPLEAATSSR